MNTFELQNFNKRIGLNTDLKNITDNLILASSTENGLDVTIPKFSLDYELNLEGDLKELGITDAFKIGKADFSNMSSKDKTLHVGGAIHKTNIDFAEKGITAAAATVVYMEGKGAIFVEKPTPIYVDINRPFMYLIKDKKTDEIWFVGTLYEPDHSEDD